MKALVRMLTASVSLGCVWSVSAAAQTSQAGTAESVPDQPWYPTGYSELRTVAARQIATFPRDSKELLYAYDDDPRGETYGLTDCGSAPDLPEDMDFYEAALAELALEVARLRSEMGRLGYNREIYEQPLLDFERGELAAIAENRSRGVYSEVAPAESGEPKAGESEEFPELAMSEYGDLADLAEDMDARRARLQPRLPDIVYEDGCCAPFGDFKIRLVPPNGKLWLVNAFAFRVCERKVGDPWDHVACGWTLYSDGEGKTATGRYMFEARWPDGTVRRGAKILEPDMSGNEEVTIITFRRQ